MATQHFENFYKLTNFYEILYQVGFQVAEYKFMGKYYNSNRLMKYGDQNCKYRQSIFFDEIYIQQS